MQYGLSLVAALLALKSTPSEQRGDLANRVSCQVFRAFSEQILRATAMHSASVGEHECLNFSDLLESALNKAGLRSAKR
jgi:hypothetical protein